MPSVLFCDIDLINAKGWHMPHAYVGVRDGRIDYVGSNDPTALSLEDPSHRTPYAQRYDGRGKLLMPGLYNAHSHVPMTLLRGLGENLPLDRWPNEAIFPVEAHITDDDAYWATQVGIAEMLRFGVVSCTDMYLNSEPRAKATIESGFKCNVGHSVMDFDPDITYDRLPESKKNQELLKAFHGAADGRVLIDFNLHAEYTSTPQVARGLAQAAKEMGVRMQVHVSETAAEVEGCKERHNGMTPVEYMLDCGVFDVPTTAAHCVWVNDNDRRILSEKGVFVATCPASNAKLGSGVADVIALCKAGITVTLGSDGVASNNNHNMFKDMYLLALMQRAHEHTPLGLSSADIIEMATRNGALSQGRKDCGDVVVGNRADLIVLDIDTPWMTPDTDLPGALIYSAQGSDVVLTMVDGEVLYRNGEYLTIDVERAMANLKESRARILTEL